MKSTSSKLTQKDIKILYIPFFKDGRYVHHFQTKRSLGYLVFLFLGLFLLSMPNPCPAQRRNNIKNFGRRSIDLEELIEVNEYDEPGDNIGDEEVSQRARLYDIILDLGLGNFTYEEHSNLGLDGEQGVYSSDLITLKSILKITEIRDKWNIDIGGGILGTTKKIERWWSNQKLFRVNKLYVRGLSIDTVMRYNFEEKDISKFNILATPNVGAGFVYYFYGLRRDQGVNLIENTINIPTQVDIALFGIEPVIGLSLAMDDGRMSGYADIGTGIYGASVEKNYSSRSDSAAIPDKTYARSVIARIGLKGQKGRFYYHLGYSVARFKITAKGNISDSRIEQNRLVGYLGARF